MTINVTLQMEIDENACKEHGLTPEYVAQHIVARDDDICDGGYVTTYIDGCDCTSDFFLGGTMLVSVFEEPPLSSLLDVELEDDETEEGGTSFPGETVGEFIDSLGDEAHEIHDVWDLNEALEACGICPIEPRLFYPPEEVLEHD